MGRKTNLQNARRIVQSIQSQDEQLRVADIGKKTGLHPQAIFRLLTTIEEMTGTLLQEDDKGRLGIFKKK